MKLQLSLAQISSQAFIGGFRTLRRSKFGSADAWAIFKAGQLIDENLANLFRIRQEIEQRFAKTDGNLTFVPAAAVPAFQNEIRALEQEQIEIRWRQKLRLPDDCLIEPDEMGALVAAGLVEPPGLEENIAGNGHPMTAELPTRSGPQKRDHLLS